MLPILLFALIRTVFAAKESEQITAPDLAGARKSRAYLLPEKANNPEHNTGYDDSISNVTDPFLLETLQMQFQEARQPTTKPVKMAMFLRSRATYRRRIYPKVSSNQTANYVGPKITAVFSETDFGKETKKLLRKIREVSRYNSSEIGNKTYFEIIREFPTNFQYFLSATDESERGLLLAYANNSSDTNYIVKCLENYNQAKRNERTTLQTLVVESGTKADEIVAGYKALRRGVAWTHVKQSKDLKQFFDTPSVLLREYEAVKRDEQNSIDRFLIGPLHYLKMKSSKRRIHKRFDVPHEATTAPNHSEGTTKLKKSDTAAPIFLTAIIIILIFSLIGCVCSCMWCYQTIKNWMDSKTPSKSKPETEQTPLRSLNKLKPTPSPNPEPKNLPESPPKTTPAETTQPKNPPTTTQKSEAGP